MMNLWEVIRSWVWSPYEGTNALIRETSESSPHFLPSEDTVRRCCLWTRKQGLPRHQVYQYLACEPGNRVSPDTKSTSILLLRTTSLQNCEKSFYLVYKPPSLLSFLTLSRLRQSLRVSQIGRKEYSWDAKLLFRERNLPHEFCLLLLKHTRKGSWLDFSLRWCCKNANLVSLLTKE